MTEMATLQMSWQPYRRTNPPLGLKNQGNTCYFNSVLQCLTYTPPLANFCLSGTHTFLCNVHSDCPFCFLENRIRRSLTIDKEKEAPVQLYNSLNLIAKDFQKGRQEDAHEFLLNLMDACAKSTNNNSQGRDIFKEIFGGVMVAQLKCVSCAAESNRREEFEDLSPHIVEPDSPTQVFSSLNQVLSKFFGVENLEYSCQSCNQVTTAHKRLFILEAPKVLVIHLKRFVNSLNGTAFKVDENISFEEDIELAQYMSSGNEDRQPRYKLFATVVHSGHSTSYGHYYAYVKTADGRWYCCNDSLVSVVELSQVLSEKVYLLFYAQCNRQPRPRQTNNVNQVVGSSIGEKTKTGSKRKRKGNPSSDLKNDLDSLDFETLSQDAKRELQKSGWCDTVRDSMRQVKEKMGSDLSKSKNKDDAKKLLIESVRENLIQEIPNSVKKHLVDHIQRK